MFFPHLGGDGIHKAQDGAGVGAAFFLLDAQAILALAPTLAVVLRNGKDAGLGVLIHPIQDGREW